jgi:hypothetical protein
MRVLKNAQAISYPQVIRWSGNTSSSLLTIARGYFALNVR